MRLYQFTVAALAFVNQASALLKPIEPEKCIQETTEHDLIYPWDGPWPKLQKGKNYTLQGKMEGEAVMAGEST